MAEDHEGPLAGLGDVHLDAVRLHRSVADLAHLEPLAADIRPHGTRPEFTPLSESADGDEVGRGTLSVALLVVPGVFFQAVGSEQSNLFLFGAGTAVQGLGLVIHCRSKERCSWWALLALLPMLGWVVAVSLRSAEQLEELARVQSRRGRSSLVGAACLLLLLSICAMPRAALFDVHREGHALVQALQSYKDQHGVYPARLEELGVAPKYPSVGWRGIRYRTSEDGNRFFLTCFVARFGTTDERVTYDSEAVRWRSYR